jgi:uncharacterized membrane protein
MLVVVFDEEGKAYEGSRALADLHKEGNVSVYAAAVVSRGVDGKVSVKDDADEGPIGTALGMMTGALLGVLAGPEGVILGAAAGGMMGSVGDLINLGVGVDFLDEVSSKLEPGKTAVVAEVSESWVTPVDTRMEALGGTVFRRYRADVEDEQIERDIEATKAEWEDLESEYREANQETKARLQAKMDSTKAKLSAAGDRAKAKIEDVKKEGQAKMDAVEKQMGDANEETRAQLGKRAADLKSSYETRTNKLSQAWELTKQAVAG